ncbi:acyl carrier protein [Nocardia sp. NPDC046763]|uniref:acyl carrier protein n=1 Tax=Nocardia sp. NPDC046763 TaxID=3155256 RepID=UPI0033FBDC14
MNDTMFAQVRTAVAEALGIEEDEVTADASLLDELGAESIDLLDILFRIERLTGTKITVAELSNYVQGGIPDEEFGDEEANVITEAGMAQLKKVMPQLAEMDLDGKLQPERVMSLFTVANLVALVETRAAVTA